MSKLIISFIRNIIENNKKESIITQIQHAIRKKDMNQLKDLINTGADLNFRNSSSCETLLTFACYNKYCDYDTMKLLIDNGANVNNQNKYGETALEKICFHSSPKCDNVELFKLFISNGADVNISSKYGITPLVSACHVGNENLVKLLLDNGANINININPTHYNMYPPLVEACKHRNKNIVKLLLDNGADPNIRATSGNTALIEACKLEEKDIVRLLLANRANVNILDYQDHQELTALKIAISRENIDLIKILFEYNVNIDVVDNSGKNPISYTSNLVIIKMLKEEKIKRLIRQQPNNKYIFNPIL